MEKLPHEIQAKATIAAGLLQSGAVRLDVAQLVGGDSRAATAQLRTAVNKIYEAMFNPE